MLSPTITAIINSLIFIPVRMQREACQRVIQSINLLIGFLMHKKPIIWRIGQWLHITFISFKCIIWLTKRRFSERSNDSYFTMIIYVKLETNCFHFISCTLETYLPRYCLNKVMPQLWRCLPKQVKTPVGRTITI